MPAQNRHHYSRIMKKNTCSMLNQLILAGLVLAAPAQNLRAEDDFVINKFGAEENAVWSRWWGGSSQIYEVDPGVDAAQDANSGSLKATILFDKTLGDNQFAVYGNFKDASGNTVTLDGSKYTNLVFDIRYEAGSAVNSSGNFGTLETGFKTTDWAQIWLKSQTIPNTASNGWLHVELAIDPSAAKIDTINGVVLKMWAGSSLDGAATFWVDNVILHGKKDTTIVRPTMAIDSRLTTGLNVYASASGAQYQRQNIHTLLTDTNDPPNANNYAWVGQSKPVTYSFSLKSFPGTNYAGFQAHLFLVPQSALVYGADDTAVDWNAGSLIFLQLTSDANGLGIARFMVKTNQPGGNSMLWNANPATGPAGTLAFVTNDTPLGTWSVTFSQNTAVTLTAPNGSATNFTLGADTAALFAEPLIAYLGAQPNNLDFIGQKAVFNRFQITGAETALDDSFAAETLDTGKWKVAAQDNAGVMLVPSTTAFSLSWTLPAVGFNLQASDTLQPGSWFDPGWGNIVQLGPRRMVLVPAAALTNATPYFFRLQKP